MTAKLLKIYDDILNYAGMVQNEKGYVLGREDKSQIFVESHQLVTPVKFQMSECTDRERVIFHPLAENNVLGESNVLKKLRFAVNIRLNQIIGQVGQGLLAIVASETKHKHLSPEQLQMMRFIRNADMTSAANFGASAIALMKETPDRGFAHVFLCRGGTMKQQKYARLGVASFPFYRNLIETGKIPRGRERDKETFKELMEFMFPGLEEENAYSEGSDSQVAPFLQALMMSSARIAGRLNDLVNIYENFLVSAEMPKDSLTFNMDWFSEIAEMQGLGADIRSIPAQNDGPIKLQEAQPAAVLPVAAPTVNNQVQAPMYMVPQAPVAPPPVVKTKDGIDFRSVIGNPPPPQVFPQQPQMVMTPNGPMMVAPQQMQPMQMMPQGMMPQQMPQQMMPQQQMMMTPNGPVMMAPNGMMVPATPPAPTWAAPDPSITMVMTQQGPMTMAVAQQYNIPFSMAPQQVQTGMSNTPRWG